MKIMKKAITAAEEVDTIYNGAFEDIAFQAYKINYDMTVSTDGEFKMTLKCTEDEKFMPEINVTTVEEDGTYYFNADVKFPELKYDDMDYADSVSYWVSNKWTDVAKFITSLSKFSFTPGKDDVYEED